MNNAQFVENVRAICKRKGFSITKLEEQLHFGNGYIGKLATRKSSPDYDRIALIARTLEVPVSDLTGEETEEQDQSQTVADLANSVNIAMYDGDSYNEVPDDIKNLAAAFALAKKEQDIKDPALRKIVDICKKNPEYVQPLSIMLDQLIKTAERKGSANK